MSFLKTGRVEVQSIGQSLDIRELNAKAQVEIIEAGDSNNFQFAFIACKYGVPEWAHMSIDEIKDMLTLKQANEIAQAVINLSGLPEGN